MKNSYFRLIEMFKMLTSLICIAVYSRLNIHKQICRISALKKHRYVSILANGPSLKEIITKKSTLLQDTDILCLNFFGNSEYFFRIKPLYYVLLDPIFFDKTLLENNASIGTLINNIENVCWNMILFIPSRHMNTISSRIKNSNVKIQPFNATRVLGFESFQNYMYKHNLGIPSSRNVVLPSMILMINVGYENIYLYGTEFSWTKNIDVDSSNGRIFLNDKHFYNNDDINYKEKGWYLWFLRAIVDNFMAIEQIEKYAQYRNVRVINRSKGSFIDSFEYENIDRL